MDIMKLSHLYLHLFKRSCRSCGKDRMQKITLGSKLPKMMFVHFVCIALQWKPFEQIHVL